MWKKYTLYWEKPRVNLQIGHGVYISSLSEVLFEKDALKNFSKFTGKYLYQSPFFNKVRKEMFSCEFWEIFKNTFFKEHLRWLLLRVSDLQET